MSPRLKISSYVIERLSKIDLECTGCLYGLMYDGTLLVVGLSLELFDDEQNTYKQLLLNLPTEVELCGVVRFGEALTTDNKINDILQDVDITDNPIVIIINDCKLMKPHFLVHNKFEETSYEVLSAEEMTKQFVYLQLNTVLPLSCEASIAGVKNVMLSKRKKIASGQVSFNIDKTQVYLFGVASDVGLTGTSSDSTIGGLLDSMNPEQSKKKYTMNTVEIVPVNVVMKTTRDMLSEKLVKTAVKMVTTQRKPAYCISMPLRVNAMALVHRNSKLLEIYAVLVEATCRCLRLLENVLIEQLKQEGMGDGGGLRVPHTLHYLPAELGHALSRAVPAGRADADTESERRLLHQQFNLPMDRPIFRRGNAIPPPTKYLLSPHTALPGGHGEHGGHVRAVVRGHYAYHHYMQDGIDDNGWGCAYRSLQTIVSWLRYQGYTELGVPTHRLIQQCLVDIGDKPPNFLGSKQWIGSTEVSFCLETMFRINSRIMFANSGGELREYGPELVHHFQRNGSPIMIGGGVLAHTIIGVEYNPENNETKYLILDPHYTGPEDLATILGKGYCGWKTSDFWNKTAHYNLCLPQLKPAI